MPKYCLGLPLAETRTISDEERRKLSQWTEKSRRKQAILRTIAWLMPSFLVMALAASNSIPEAGAVILVLSLTLGIAPICLWARDAKRRYQILETATLTDEVQVFSQDSDWQDESDGIWFIRSTTNGLIIDAATFRERHLVLTEVEETALTPQHQPPQELFPPLHFGQSPEATVVRRPMSSDELTELQKVARTRVVKFTFWNYLSLAYLGFAIFAWVFQPGVVSVVRAFVSFILLLLGSSVVYSRCKLYRQFKQDISGAFVVHAEDGDQIAEFLPNSGYLWTIEGAPSPDRRIGVSTKRF